MPVLLLANKWIQLLDPLLALLYKITHEMILAVGQKDFKNGPKTVFGCEKNILKLLFKNGFNAHLPNIGIIKYRNKTGPHCFKTRNIILHEREKA